MRIVVVLALLVFSTVVFADQPAPIRPDSKLTPGATFDVILQDISEPGYSKKVRHVTAELKREVFAEYGITEHKLEEYEVDHLIPLSIGGSNSIKNLWPESYRPVWNARVKDRLEDRLTASLILKQHSARSRLTGSPPTRNMSGPPPSAIVLVSPQESQTKPRHANLVAKPQRQPNPPQLKFG